MFATTDQDGERLSAGLTVKDSQYPYNDERFDANDHVLALKSNWIKYIELSETWYCESGVSLSIIYLNLKNRRIRVKTEASKPLFLDLIGDYRR